MLARLTAPGCGGPLSVTGVGVGATKEVPGAPRRLVNGTSSSWPAWGSRLGEAGEGGGPAS